MHASCSICGDLFTGIESEVVHSTPCGHIFHYVCLLEWLQRSSTCPHCRARVNENKTIKLYFQISNLVAKDSSTLENEIQSLKFQLTLKNIDLNKLKEEASKANSSNKELRNIVHEREEEIRCNTTVVSNLQNQIKMVNSQLKTLTETQRRVEELEIKLRQYESLEKILHGSVSDAAEASDILKEYSDPSILSTCINSLKKEVCQYKEKSRDYQRFLDGKDRALTRSNTRISKLEEQLSILDRSLCKVKEDLANSEKENRILASRCKKLQEAITSSGSQSCSSDLKDKVIRRLINEFPAPELQNSSSNGLDVTLPVNIEKKKLSKSPTSSAIKDIKSKFLLNKRRIFPNTRSETNLPCYDGLGGHQKEEITRTDKATLLNAIERSKTNKILPPVKRMKTTSVTKQQANLLQFGVKKV